MIRGCFCQMLNTNRIAMLTVLTKRFRNIQITLGRREDLKDSRGSGWIQMGSELLMGPKGNHISTSSTDVVPLCLWKFSPSCSGHNCGALLGSTALCSGFENGETETDANANSHSHKVKMVTKNTKALEHVSKLQQMKTPSPEQKPNPVTC